MTASAEAAAISDGPLPKHLQLTALLTALAADELSPGEAIPSERELMTTYVLSRATVRRSIESLISDGLWSGCTAREPSSPAPGWRAGCTSRRSARTCVAAG